MLASLSKCFLMYCDIRNAKGEKRQIVAAMTNGAADNITVGRNGVFYDRQGDDWDATVTKVVDSPISVRAAFWAPYKKVLRSVEEFVTKRAAAAEAESDAKLGTAVTSAQSAVEGAPKEVSRPSSISVWWQHWESQWAASRRHSVHSMSSFFGLGIWMPLGVLGVILVISGPSMAIAWLKLRQRNLAPLLDANGWAINSHAKLNVRFGEALTKVATLPKGACPRSLGSICREASARWASMPSCCSCSRSRSPGTSESSTAFCRPSRAVSTCSEMPHPPRLQLAPITPELAPAPAP